MARDFLHTSALVDAVIAVLTGADGAAHTGGLPANWFADAQDDLQTPLKLLEHGDLTDYANQAALLEDLPAILVRGRGLRRGPEQSISGILRTLEQIRVVHVRGFDQCQDTNGARFVSMTRAREWYAKTLGQALFSDDRGMLAVIAINGTRTDPTLTCADDNGARVLGVTWTGWDLGLEDGEGATPEVSGIRALDAQVWAIACDLEILVQTGGATA